MIYECKLTKKDLEGQWIKQRDCPLFRSMKRSKVPILSMGGTCFITTDERNHDFTSRISQLSRQILDGDRSNLIGERFTVES